MSFCDVSNYHRLSWPPLRNGGASRAASARTSSWKTSGRRSTWKAWRRCESLGVGPCWLSGKTFCRKLDRRKVFLPYASCSAWRGLISGWMISSKFGTWRVSIRRGLSRACSSCFCLKNFYCKVDNRRFFLYKLWVSVYTFYIYLIK